MINVAALDDNRRILNQIEELVDGAIRGTKEKVEFSQFTSGEQFCARADMESLDIVFMDIEMEDMNGIKTAKHFRKLNKHAKIIYVSAYETYFRHLYSVTTFGFLDKPIDDLKFQRMFRDACTQIRTHNDTFAYAFGKTIHRMLIRDIMYFRSIAHRLYIHCQNSETIQYYEKLSDVADRLATVDFLQISKSYLVNLKYVDKLNLSEVTLVNGEILPVSRTFRDQVFRDYCKYIERRSHR